MYKLRKDNVLVILFCITTLIAPLGFVFKSAFLSKLGFVMMNTPLPLVFYYNEIAAQVEMRAYHTNGEITDIAFNNQQVEKIKGPLKRLSQYLGPFFLDVNKDLSQSVYKYAFCGEGHLNEVFDIKDEIESFEFYITYRSSYFNQSWSIPVKCM